MYIRALTPAENAALAIAEGVGAPSTEYRAWLVALAAAHAAYLGAVNSPLPYSSNAQLPSGTAWAASGYWIAPAPASGDIRNPTPAEYAYSLGRNQAAIADYAHAIATLQTAGGYGGAPANWSGPWRFGTLRSDGSYLPLASPDGQML